MKKRAFVNLALCMLIIAGVFFSFADQVNAGSRNFATSFGTMTGSTTPNGAYYAVSNSQAGNIYWINVYLKGWGACSPDMGCTWKVKDSQNLSNNWKTYSPTAVVSLNWIAISKHSFQQVQGTSVYSGYTSGDNNNAYGKYNCWVSFAPSC